MRHELVGRALRALRHRRGLRQSDVAVHARIARSVLVDLEAGRLGTHTVDALTNAAGAVGGSIRIDLLVPGGDVQRLVDADHAALQSQWKALLERDGWTVEAEVTFNHFGERGSIDLVAWHPAARALLIIEIKTVIVDIQSLLSGIDRKVRIGRMIGADRGWRSPGAIPVLIVAEGSTARRRLAEHAALFARFSLRGRRAVAWIRDPQPLDPPAGMLMVAKLPAVRPEDRRRAGRQRIRLDRPSSRSMAARKSLGEPGFRPTVRRTDG
jgi:transcriptional regulator with XRE-family HTH domain